MMLYLPCVGCCCYLDKNWFYHHAGLFESFSSKSEFREV